MSLQQSARDFSRLIKTAAELMITMQELVASSPSHKLNKRNAESAVAVKSAQEDFKKMKLARAMMKAACSQKDH
jgi:hypothetical protein